MVDKHSNEKTTHTTDFSCCALLIRAVKFLMSVFSEKIQAVESQESFKTWEREKFSNFGLAAHSASTRHSAFKDVSFSSWNREKMSDFGLTPHASCAIKKTSEYHIPQEKSALSPRTPKISPEQAWKKTPKPHVFKNAASHVQEMHDDFFKVLGYE